MIKAVILDVDGVIVGKKEGHNFPLPHSNVIKKLKQIRSNGLPVILCTSKYYPAVVGIANDALLANPHITDSGALIIDILNKKVIKEHLIGKVFSKKIIELSLEKNIYIEVYSIDNYYIQKDQVGSFTEKRTTVLQQKPVIVSSLSRSVDRKDIIKIIVYAKNDQDKTRLIKLFAPYQTDLTIIWSFHPFIVPAVPYVFTANGVSKKTAAREVMQVLKVSFDDVLGIGDTLSDWEFMQLCGYVGAMGNATDELKKLVLERGKGGFIGQDVDNHGILDIFKYFSV